MATRTKNADSEFVDMLGGDLAEEPTANPEPIAEPAPKASKKRPKPRAEGEPSFEDLSVALAVADAKARATSADAGQARGERSTIAVSTIKAAYSETLTGESVRESLLGAGVLKGTVSKIVTVLTALQEGVISPVDVKSLNGAYNLVKQVRATTLAAAAALGGTGAPTVVTAAPGHVVTPEEALEVILLTITSEKDADKAFKLGGEWITKVTNAITAALKAKGTGEEE